MASESQKLKESLFRAALKCDKSVATMLIALESEIVLLKDRVDRLEGKAGDPALDKGDPDGE